MDPTTKCVVYKGRDTVHLHDPVRSKPGHPWTKCSWPPPSGDVSVLSYASVREKHPHAVPCDECFPGRVFPEG